MFCKEDFSRYGVWAVRALLEFVVCVLCVHVLCCVAVNFNITNVRCPFVYWKLNCVVTAVIAVGTLLSPPYHTLFHLKGF